jgi:hypothetical protein
VAAQVPAWRAVVREQAVLSVPAWLAAVVQVLQAVALVWPEVALGAG